MIIAEDSYLIREMLTMTLDAAPEIELVAVCSNAKELQTALARWETDVVLTDIRMPGVSGFEVMRAVLATGQPTYVVLMTAYANVSDAVAAVKLGAYDYIQKPFDGEEIKILVERTLEHARLKLENAALKTMTAEVNLPRPLVGSCACCLTAQPRPTRSKLRAARCER